MFRRKGGLFAEGTARERGGGGAVSSCISLAEANYRACAPLASGDSNFSEQISHLVRLDRGFSRATDVPLWTFAYPFRETPAGPLLRPPTAKCDDKYHEE
jgi:hypothetical protein